MDWLVVKTGALLNSSAAVLDTVVESGSRFEATLSPAAMRVVKGSKSSRFAPPPSTCAGSICLDSYLTSS